MKHSTNWIVIKCILICALFGISQQNADAVAADAGTVGADAKRITEVDDHFKIGQTMTQLLVNDINLQIERAPELKGKHIVFSTLKPLIWQAYVWLGYQLCEEAILVAKLEPLVEKRNLLVRATRYPYTPGMSEWRIEWRPSEVIDGSKQFEWTIVREEELKPPGAILKWGYERQFFERTESVGSPLLQRWIFTINWRLAVGRDLTRAEKAITGSSGTPPSIVVPLTKS